MPTLNRPRRTGYSAHSVLCGVMHCVQVTVDMDPISVMKIFIKFFLFICIHVSQIRTSLYPATPVKVTESAFFNTY
jgi:hypothetical protein